jgi:hypothetical protein
MGEEDECMCEPKDKNTQVYFNAQSNNFLMLLQQKCGCLQLYRKLVYLFLCYWIKFQFAKKEW